MWQPSTVKTKMNTKLNDAYGYTIYCWLIKVLNTETIRKSLNTELLAQTSDGYRVKMWHWTASQTRNQLREKHKAN